jgi:hypothetical protein
MTYAPGDRVVDGAENPNGATSMASFWLIGPCWVAGDITYFIQPGLKAELIERTQRQRGESADAPVQHQVGIFEREGDLSRSRWFPPGQGQASAP